MTEKPDDGAYRVLPPWRLERPEPLPPWWRRPHAEERLARLGREELTEALAVMCEVEGTPPGLPLEHALYVLAERGIDVAAAALVSIGSRLFGPAIYRLAERADPDSGTPLRHRRGLRSRRFPCR